MKPRRALILQSYVPAYRLPLFHRLATVPNLRVRVVAGVASATALELKNKKGNPGFDYALAKMTYLWGGRVSWHHVGAQLRWVKRGDVIVISGNPRIVSNLLVIANARARGVGVLWWGQGWTAGSRGTRARVRQYLMKYADAILLYTDSEREQYLHQGFDPERTFAANNAIDQDRIKDCSERVNADSLAQFQYKEQLLGKRLILFCGRIERKAELSVLIAAIPRIIEEYPELVVVVIGDGTDRMQCETLARSLGVDDRIRWLGAIYEEGDLAPWFLSSSLFVYPGSIGLSLLHAFGYGLPVVTHGNAVFQMPEFSALESGKNGLIFQRGSSEGLSDAVMDILRNDELRSAMGRAARATVETKYSMASMIDRFLASIEAASKVASARRRLRTTSKR